MFWIDASARRIFIKEILVTGEHVSKKSIPFYWVKSLATNLALYLSTVPSVRVSSWRSIYNHRFASWRKVSENPSVTLHYELDLTVNDFFLGRRFRRDHCFLERSRITFYKIGEEVLIKGLKSPSSFAPSRLRIIRISRTRRKNIRGRRSNRGITRDYKFERTNVLKIDSIPNFNYGVIGYFTNLRVNH